VIAAVDGQGRLVFRDMGQSGYPQLAACPAGLIPKEWLTRVLVRLDAEPIGGGARLSLSARNPETGAEAASFLQLNIEAARVVGGLALVSHPGEANDGARYWF
jgi:hypothetical protein